MQEIQKLVRSLLSENEHCFFDIYFSEGHYCMAPHVDTACGYQGDLIDLQLPDPCFKTHRICTRYSVN
jgi:hypothetical protein